MSTISLLGHSTSQKPKHSFLSYGAVAGAVFVLSLIFIMWYGCGWIVDCQRLWREAFTDHSMPTQSIDEKEIGVESREMSREKN